VVKDDRLGVRQFFRWFFPFRRPDDVREDVFFLTYGSKGAFTPSGSQAMKSRERLWWVEGCRQLRDEEAAARRARKTK
jgi:hypothetical protein